MIPALSARGAAKVYDGVTALRPTDLDVPPGQRLALLGDNGAGKSTLLRLAAGVSRPSAGSVRLFGVPAHEPPARARLGYAPEGAPLPPDLRPLELLTLLGRLSGLRDAPTRARRLLEQLDLGGCVRRRVRELSTGLRQRLALAQALLHDPDLLLLDEPLTGLDAPSRARVRALVSDACGRGATLVLTSHRLVDVADLCDRVAVVRDGHLHDLGPTHRALAVLPARVHFDLPRGAAEPALGAPVPTGGATRAREVSPAERDALLAEIRAAGGHVLQVEPVLAEPPPEGA